MTTPLQLDHLVVAAATLEQGTAWCRATFGVAPAAGGRHAFMGTHNRLLRLHGATPETWSEAYLEIIAIDPDAPRPDRARWFGLDEPTVQAAVATAPRLVHWVVRAADSEAVRADWAARGVDPGPVEFAERQVPGGWLRWRITIPGDGRPADHGRVPALIAWEGPHPAARIDPPAALELLGVHGLALPGDSVLDGAAPATARWAGPPDGSMASRADVSQEPLRFRLRGPGGVAELVVPEAIADLD